MTPDENLKLFIEILKEKGFDMWQIRFIIGLIKTVEIKKKSMLNPQNVYLI